MITPNKARLLKSEIAAKNRNKFFLIHFDKSDKIYFYSVFTKKALEKNKELIKKPTNLKNYINKNNYGFKIFYEDDESKAFKYFTRG